MTTTEAKLLEALAYLADNVDEDCPSEYRTTRLNEALCDARELVANERHQGGTMTITEPTPAIHAASLKAALINQSLYDEDDPDTSISDLLADIMHLIDAEDCNSFESQCERAELHYTAEVNEINTTKEAL